MSIFLNQDSKVIVQGMTGSEGMKHTTRMLASGTAIVGGVNPRKAGQSVDFPSDVTVPVFGGVAEAIAATGANVSVVFVPPPFAKAAVVEAVDAGIPLVVVITEGIPVKDTAEFFAYCTEPRAAPASSARTAPASSAPGSPTPASSPPTSPAPGGSAWSASPGR